MAPTLVIEINYAAYSTLILHCSKHVASEVMGFLLGSVTSSKVTIVKSIPVQHHWNRLSPMVEVAASLTQAYAASQSPPLQLIGIYHAPSDIASSIRSELSPAAIKLAQSVSIKLGSEAVVLQVNNSLLSSTAEHALRGFSVSSSGGNPQASVTVQLEGDEASVSRVRKATADGSWKNIHDFDDHLEDTSINWLEPIIAV